MKKTYLVYYDRTSDTTGKYCEWSGFCPDIPGCVSVGDNLEHMRAMMREAMEGLLELMAEDGDVIPPPSATSIDFADHTPDMDVAYTIVEWLEVQLPPHAIFAGQQSTLVGVVQE